MDMKELKKYGMLLNYGSINMKDNIIALAIVLAIYSAVIWGIPLALGIEVFLIGRMLLTYFSSQF